MVIDKFGIYEIRQMKNGLTRYKIKTYKSERDKTIKEVKRVIKENNQIIVMEGQTYFDVMEMPLEISDIS